MLCLFLLSVITISLSGICSEHVVEARNVEYSQDMLLCIARCSTKGRSCIDPPEQCGPCLEGRAQRDGVCLHLEKPSSKSASNVIEGCPQLTGCKENCQYGQMTDQHRCPLCRCLPNPPDTEFNPECPIPMCDNDCPNGYAKSKKGCMLCTCKHSVIKEREVLETDNNIDTLLAEFRRIESQKQQDEIAKDLQAPEDANIEQESDSGTTTSSSSPTNEKQVALASSGENSEPLLSTFDQSLVWAVVAGCSVAGLVGLVVAGVCWYRLQKNVKAASEVEYPAYGITGPTKGELGSPGDRKLAQSAQMYHYQHQKQQMIALEKANGEMKNDGSEDDSDEENEEGDYTVYECPGLAPTGEMEVKNPLFSEETPVTPTPDDRRGEMK